VAVDCCTTAEETSCDQSGGEEDKVGEGGDEIHVQIARNREAGINLRLWFVSSAVFSPQKFVNNARVQNSISILESIACLTITKGGHSESFNAI